MTFFSSTTWVQANSGLDQPIFLFQFLDDGVVSQALIEKMAEAEDLLEEVSSWSEEEVRELSKLYREKAREYRRLKNSGDQ